MANENTKNDTDKQSGFKEFLSAKNDLVGELADTILYYFQQDKRPETDFVEIYMSNFRDAVKSAGQEVLTQYDSVDRETVSLIDNHVNNTGAIKLFRSTTTMLEKRSGVLGFLEKIIPIVEIIKKLLTQITELFPNFLERILKKIILPILELIDNALAQILELFSNKTAPAYLKNAEEHFLTVHPKWRKMLFDTVEVEVLE